MGETLHSILSRLVAYVAVAVAIGLLFLAGASVYELMSPRPVVAFQPLSPRRGRSTRPKTWRAKGRQSLVAFCITRNLGGRPPIDAGLRVLIRRSMITCGIAMLIPSR